MTAHMTGQWAATLGTDAEECKFHAPSRSCRAIRVSDCKVCVSCQQPVAAKKAIASSDSINRSLVSGSMWLRVPLHSALVSLHLELQAMSSPRGLNTSLGGPQTWLQSLHVFFGCGNPTMSVGFVSSENVPPPEGFAGLSYLVFLSS